MCRDNNRSITMPMNLDEIIDAAMLLDEADRFQIVSRLLETLPNELPGLTVDDPEFLTELERRADNLEGAVPLLQLWNRV